MQQFPVLRITGSDLEAKGTFAEAQAAFLSPNQQLVTRLDALLKAKKIGVVAHYYMDPELQGVLSACTHEHIGVSDSLKMADRGIHMVEAGCEAIVVLGVDFMSENARAMLDAAGKNDTPVYRVAEAEIGCSLAESAEAAAYGAFLAEGAKAENPLHVVYINTSLVTKAKAHSIIPTITCTSSNVLQTVLQADAQIDDVNIFFGPDTYMGENLATMLKTLSTMDDAAIKSVHPAHDQKSIAALCERFNYFKQGNCVVHHMFGADVVNQVKDKHPDALVTAHLEVPGEMFTLGLERQGEDRGVVGSTSNILGFILRKVDEALADGSGLKDGKLEFILGTEAGMITPIVREVQKRLSDSSADFAVDIVFPVASEAVAQTGEEGLPVVPGVFAGEGCTTAGGCATCPYMKMNSLDALLSVCEQIGSGDAALEVYKPRTYTEMIAGRTAADLGGEPILHMRAFATDKALPKALLDQVTSA